MGNSLLAVRDINHIYIVVESSGYVELSYKDFYRRRQTDQSYMDKLFIPLQGCLLEVMLYHFS
jgi:hypothetical protein